MFFPFSRGLSGYRLTAFFVKMGGIWCVLTVIRCNQLLSVVISCNQKHIRKHQRYVRKHQRYVRKHQRYVKKHQRYVKMHQKTPVFLIKYCHNKDLKKMNHRFQQKNPKSEYLNPKQILMTEILMTKINIP